MIKLTPKDLYTIDAFVGKDVDGKVDTQELGAFVGMIEERVINDQSVSAEMSELHLIASSLIRKAKSDSATFQSFPLTYWKGVADRNGNIITTALDDHFLTADMQIGNGDGVASYTELISLRAALSIVCDQIQERIPFAEGLDLLYTETACELDFFNSNALVMDMVLFGKCGFQFATDVASSALLVIESMREECVKEQEAPVLPEIESVPNPQKDGLIEI